MRTLRADTKFLSELKPQGDLLVCGGDEVLVPAKSKVSVVGEKNNRLLLKRRTAAGALYVWADKKDLLSEG